LAVAANFLYGIEKPKKLLLLGQILGRNESIIARNILKLACLKLFQKFWISLLGTASKISSTPNIAVYSSAGGKQYPLTFSSNSGLSSAPLLDAGAHGKSVSNKYNYSKRISLD